MAATASVSASVRSVPLPAFAARALVQGAGGGHHRAHRSRLLCFGSAVESALRGGGLRDCGALDAGRGSPASRGGLRGAAAGCSVPVFFSPRLSFSARGSGGGGMSGASRRLDDGSTSSRSCPGCPSVVALEPGLKTRSVCDVIGDGLRAMARGSTLVLALFARAWPPGFSPHLSIGRAIRYRGVLRGGTTGLGSVGPKCREEAISLRAPRTCL